MTDKPKIESLTPEQEAKLPLYSALAIELGLAAGPEFDREEVLRYIDEYRARCGMPPTPELLVYDSPFAAMDAHKELSPNNALYGQHDAYWLCFYLFWRTECGLIEETEAIVPLLELAKRINWFWLADEATVVTRRPVEVHTTTLANGVQVLHKEGGMAMRFADNTGLWVLKNVEIPDEYSWGATDSPEELKGRLKDILSIPNTEIRGRILARIGDEKVLASLEDTRVLDTASLTPGGDYTLYQVNLGNDLRRIYLAGHCPSSGKSFFEGVPPETDSILAALAWRESDSETYKLPVHRT